MRRKFLTIELPEPCREDWAEMTPCARGRHCAACDKVLTDFSVMGDAELVAFLQRNPGACGRFTAGQIQRAIPVDAPRPRPSWYGKAAALLFLLLGTEAPAWSQTHRPRTTQSPVKKPVRRSEIHVRVETCEGMRVANQEIVVLDEAGQRLPGRFQTDLYGWFRLPYATYGKARVRATIPGPGKRSVPLDFYGPAEQKIVLRSSGEPEIVYRVMEQPLVEQTGNAGITNDHLLIRNSGAANPPASGTGRPQAGGDLILGAPRVSHSLYFVDGKQINGHAPLVNRPGKTTVTRIVTRTSLLLGPSRLLRRMMAAFGIAAAPAGKSAEKRRP